MQRLSRKRTRAGLPILRYALDGTQETIYAHGLRNAVGITFRPGTGELWATNNGRDFLGDDLPPETIYQVKEGANYGWPRCHAGRIVDPDFGDTGACQGVGDPQVEMQAHSAPFGLVFYDHEQFPSLLPRRFVCGPARFVEPQSAGRLQSGAHPDQDGQPGPVQDFATGWLLPDGSAWGRPVGLAVGPGRQPVRFRRRRGYDLPHLVRGRHPLSAARFTYPAPIG